MYSIFEASNRERVELYIEQLDKEIAENDRLLKMVKDPETARTLQQLFQPIRNKYNEIKAGCVTP